MSCYLSCAPCSFPSDGSCSSRVFFNYSYLSCPPTPSVAFTFLFMCLLPPWHDDYVHFIKIRQLLWKSIVVSSFFSDFSPRYPRFKRLWLIDSGHISFLSVHLSRTSSLFSPNCVFHCLLISSVHVVFLFSYRPIMQNIVHLWAEFRMYFVFALIFRIHSHFSPPFSLSNVEHFQLFSKWETAAHWC